MGGARRSGAGLQTLGGLVSRFIYKIGKVITASSNNSGDRVLGKKILRT